MIKKALVLAASVAALAMAQGANAEDFTFSFTGDGSFPGTVTGTVSGLADAGTSTPSSVSATYNGFNFSASPQGNNDAGSFTVTNGLITSDSFFIDDRGTSSSGITRLTFNGGSAENYISGPNGSVSNNDGFIGVTYTPVASTVSAAPEPTTWLLMFMGVGALGLMLRRRRSMGTLAAA